MKTTNDDLLLLQSHNPIPETGETEWAASEAGSLLFSQIETNAEESRLSRKRSRWRRPTVTVPVFVMLSATVLLFASAIAGDKVVSVTAHDALTDPSRVERRLSAEGIEARIQAVPVKDALIGRWFHLYLDPASDVEAETFALLRSYVGQIDYRYDSVEKRCRPTAAPCERTSLLEIPGSVTGPITLVVGRAAQPGEGHWARNMDWGNELAPSGALYCYALEEKGPEATLDVLEAAGYEVIFNYDLKDNSAEVTSIPADAALATATFRDVDTVVLNYAPIKGQPDYPSAQEQRLMMGTPTDQTGRPNFGAC